MRIHFIAIGGSAMHNLAIALKIKGMEITGSDDEIFEPSRSRLKAHNLLPPYNGWNEQIITPELDAVIVGMHARTDNPELIKARQLGVKIYSYPEYLYEQTKDKTRIVIGGSHGKTTITAMVMHILRYNGMVFDYMVGAQLDGFNNMVSLSADAPYAIFEGDEYLTSPLDPRPKFHLYHPDIAVISGIEWDHVNVFPTFEHYREQFSRFIDCIEPGGTLIYCADDSNVVQTVNQSDRTDITTIPYRTHPFRIDKNGKHLIRWGTNETALRIFGTHNMQNLSAAITVCKQIGLKPEMIYPALSEYNGAAKRLQVTAESADTTVFIDFAHSPSKVKATVKAVKESFPQRKLIACLELHTYSSLSEQFLPHYSDTLNRADLPLVYYNPDTLKHKKLAALSPNTVAKHFNIAPQQVYTDSGKLVEFLQTVNTQGTCILIMTSGNFSGINLKQLAENLCNTN